MNNDIIETGTFAHGLKYHISFKYFTLRLNKIQKYLSCLRVNNFNIFYESGFLTVFIINNSIFKKYVFAFDST